MATFLQTLGWLVETEVTYSEFGERGSFDLLAFHPGAAVLLVIESKTDLPSAEATLRKLDEKARLAGTVGQKRFGWRAPVVSRLLVMPESSTSRRRAARHAALFDRALPARNVAIRRWLGEPSGALRGIWSSRIKTAGLLTQPRAAANASDGRDPFQATPVSLREKDSAASRG